MQLKENMREPIGIAIRKIYLKEKKKPKSEPPTPVDDPPQPQPEPEMPEVPIENPFTIRFNAGDGGNISGNTELYKAYRRNCFRNEVPKIEPKAGYEFTGWDRNPNDYGVTSNTEFTAQYKPIIDTPALPWYKRFWNWLRNLFFGRGCLNGYFGCYYCFF